MQLATNDILKNIDCFLVDLDGTIYKGDLLLSGARDLIDTIRDLKKDYLFVTNNSSINRSITAEKLTKIGLPTVKNKILTSGEATALYLQRKHAGSRVFIIGTTALEEEFLSRGFILTDKDPEYIVLGFDTGLTYDKLWKLSELAYSGIPYIATNPDRTCLYENGFMPEIAPMIAYVESASGKKPGVVIGKPNPIMAEIASEMTGYPLKKMAIIGDSLETDIPMGKNAGIPTILILSGDTLPGNISADQPKPDLIFNDLNDLTSALVNL
jgi:4-nitrophenyl phosphatase